MPAGDTAAARTAIAWATSSRGLLCVVASACLAAYAWQLASTESAVSHTSFEYDRDGFQLAREILGEQEIRVWVRVRRGELAFRFSANLDASIAETVCAPSRVPSLTLRPHASFAALECAGAVMRVALESRLHSART